MTAEDLAARFDISLSAARIRLVDLERMKRRSRKALRPLPEFVKEYLEEGRARGARVKSIDG